MLEVETALRILQEAGIEATQVKIEPLKEGWLNKIYKLAWETGTAVLWMDGQNDPSFERRSLKLQWIYSYLADLNLPVPQLLYPIDLMPEKPAPYLLITYLPGRQLGKVLGELNPEQQVELAEIAGKALSNLHKTTASNIENIRNRAFVLGGQGSYGNPFEPSEGSGSWADYVEGQLENRVTSLRKITSTSFRDKIESFMKDRRALWSDPGHWAQPALVHNDFTPDNILVQARPDNTWEVNGIVDFEWSLIGPPEMDFAKLEAYGYPRLATTQQTRAYKEAFLNGYEQVNPLGQNHNELVTVYKLLFYLFWMSLESSWGNLAGVTNTEQLIANILNQG